MEEIFDLDPELANILWVRAVSQEMLRYAKATGEDIAQKVDSEAVRVLSEIKRVLDDPDLDDPDLDDPECFYRIDAIVDAFHQAGLSTGRHKECE